MWLWRGLAVWFAVLAATWAMDLSQPPRLPDLLPGRPVRSGVFWTGTRYARRGGPGFPAELKPRSERFFMGTRYGKRAPVVTGYQRLSR